MKKVSLPLNSTLSSCKQSVVPSILESSVLQIWCDIQYYLRSSVTMPAPRTHPLAAAEGRAALQGHRAVPTQPRRPSTAHKALQRLAPGYHSGQFITLSISPQTIHFCHIKLLALLPTQCTLWQPYALYMLLFLSGMPSPPTHSLKQRLLFLQGNSKIITSEKSPLTWGLIVCIFFWSLNAFLFKKTYQVIKISIFHQF